MFLKNQLDSFVDFEKCCKMRIWLQNFVSVQPRMSLEKSDVSWPTACCAAGAGGGFVHAAQYIERLATTHHSFLGSFSAVSKRNFATKYAFFQVFRDLQNYLADFLKKLQKLVKNRKNLQKICEIRGFL